MGGEAMAAGIGVVLQLFFAYFPKVKDWYEAQSSEAKGGIQLLLLALFAFVPVLLGCVGWFQQYAAACNQGGIEQALVNFVVGLAANQGIYLTAVRPSKKLL